jgi:hypothetical protein
LDGGAFRGAGVIHFAFDRFGEMRGNVMNEEERTMLALIVGLSFLITFIAVLVVVVN